MTLKSTFQKFLVAVVGDESLYLKSAMAEGAILCAALCRTFTKEEVRVIADELEIPEDTVGQLSAIFVLEEQTHLCGVQRGNPAILNSTGSFSDGSTAYPQGDEVKYAEVIVNHLLQDITVTVYVRSVSEGICKLPILPARLTHS